MPRTEREMTRDQKSRCPRNRLKARCFVSLRLDPFFISGLRVTVEGHELTSRAVGHPNQLEAAGLKRYRLMTKASSLRATEVLAMLSFTLMVKLTVIVARVSTAWPF